DIYSLGVVFYELLTGELPLGRFAPPSKMVQVDVRLDEVVLRALERAPESRYQHVSEVKTEVESIAHSPARRDKVTLPAGMGPQLLLCAAMMVFSVLVIAGGLVCLVLSFLETPDSGGFWGWMGGALGCILGGLGSLAGCWNSYRQL